MNQRKIFGIALAILAIFSICGTLPGIVNTEPVSASPGFTIYVPDYFAKIQWAVDNATPLDTIIVRDGTYYENVDVNKTLTIQSENGAANCVVNASNPDDHAFYVTANWVNITGFTVENATENNMAGIYLGSADHCNISSNNASNNYLGIGLESSSNNTLRDNTASNNNLVGIGMNASSNNNMLVGNTANLNYAGIGLDSSSNNSITNNNATSNSYGIHLSSSSNNTLTDNTANSNTQRGIQLSFSSNNTLTNNTADSNNYYGIRLWSSSNNTLSNNTCSNNTQRGIYLRSSSNNTIYNNYFNNTNNAYDDGNNTWNTTKTSGTNIIGGPYLGGNYWSDYAGSDTDGDGLGNTLLPYNCTGNITNGGDHLPLLVWIGATYNLAVNVTPTGGGSVTVNGVTPADYPNTTTWDCGDNVTLNATAAEGYAFGSWSGDLTGSINPDTITMNSNKSVTANFVSFSAPADVDVSAADPGIESIDVSSVELSEVNTTNMPEDVEAQQAYVVNSTGTGNFTLSFTGIANAESIIVYKVTDSDWVQLTATGSGTTLEVTIPAGDPPVVFCTPTGAPPPVGGTAYPENTLGILAPWIAIGAAIIAGASVLMLRRRRT